MCDLQLIYRERGAETRDDYFRNIANEAGLASTRISRRLS